MDDDMSPHSGDGAQLGNLEQVGGEEVGDCIEIVGTEGS